jgi:hypothetical protein
MRLKRLDSRGSFGAEAGEGEGGVSGASFLPPKSFIMEGSRFEFRALGAGVPRE